MTVAIAVLSIGVFAIAFGISRIVGVARQAVATALSAFASMRDPALDDAARERRVRRASLEMLGNFASILLRGGAVLAVSALPVVTGDRLGIVSAGAVVELLSRWDVMFGATVVLTLAWILKERAWPSR